ncbi:prepilin-type N-terminal cleavage/methylation domain-containing protein [Bradyrhizobium sp. HKCCYLS1011]|uniref:prepilin-type N-terminal cleavage/methylation domain-containing protein n=1 Tax=Bradyrhizobium sp. HKCCYLS1011 TaxID=3420733 RepID=UPI003EBB899D
MFSERRAARAGFTLIEALVAMTLLLAFMSVVGPQLFHARRIADRIDGRIAAQTLLRTLLDAPVDRAQLAAGPRSGETGGMRWSISAEPMFVEAMIPPAAAPVPVKATKSVEPVEKGPSWIAYHLTAVVSWAPGRMVTADTLRLGLPGDDR